MCHVNSYNNKKFDYNALSLAMSVVAHRTRRSFRYTLSLPHAVDMQQFNRCQMARSVL